MSSGLFALLDDIAVIAKTASASLDDIATATVQAGTKSAGVIVDDAAVTPKYVLGFAADREIPIVRKIAIGSLRNKLFYLLPAALLLSVFAPWAITPLLMLGGLFLGYEGAEKIWHSLFHKGHAEGADLSRSEADTVKGAIRTDMILSAEIMVLTLSSVADKDIWVQGIVLAAVGVMITVLVYGAVALIVRADDFGISLASYKASIPKLIGRGIVKAMPSVLTTLSVVGTAAMLWVGGGILIHGLDYYHVEMPEHLIHDAAEFVGDYAPVATGFVKWATSATMMGAFGLLAGLIVLAATALAPSKKTPSHQRKGSQDDEKQSLEAEGAGS